MHILFVCSHHSYHEAFKKYAGAVSLITCNKLLKSEEITAKNLYEHVVLVTKEELVVKNKKFADQIHSKMPVDIVMSIAEDYTEIGVKISRHLQVPFFPNPNTAQIVVDKMMTRQVLSHNHLDSIPVAKVTSQSDIFDFIEAVGLPVILKPIDSCGSRAVTRIDNEIDVTEAMEYFKTWAPDHSMIVEKFIKGKEFSVEMFSEDKKHHCICVVEKFKSGKHCVGQGHRLPAPIDTELSERIIRYVQNILTVLNVENGPTHTEVIASETDDKIHLVETHLRAGGAKIGTLLKYVWDIDVLDLWARQFAGEKVLPLIFTSHKRYNYAVVIFYTPDTKGMIKGVDAQAAYLFPGVVSAGNFRPVGSLNKGLACHSGHRAAFAIAVGDDPEETLQNAEIAVRNVKLSIEPYHEC